MSDQKKKVASPEDLLGCVGNKALPWTDDAEKGVLSCLLQDPAERVVETRITLPPESFYHPANRILYELLNECVAHGLPCDPPSITHLLRDRGLLDQVGGPSAISELFAFVPIPTHWPFYMKQVREKWLLRELIHADAQNIHEAQSHEAEAEPESVGALLSRAEGRVFKVLDMFQGEGQGNQIADSYHAVLEWNDKFIQICENRGKVLGLQTGWVDVDRTFHGLNPDGEGDLWLIGGFPGMGKTGAAVSLLESIAVDGVMDDEGNVTRTPCGVFPLEMGQVGWHHRLVLGRAGVDISVSRNGHLPRWATDRGPGGEGMSPLDKASLEIRNSPIFWDNSSFCDCDNLRARVTMMVRRHGVKVVFIDHFGQLRPSSKEGKGDMGVRGKIEIMETLHELRRTLGITIILFVQLTKDGRENQKRNRPPDNGDVKGPGEMIEYPTMVSFIHRPTVVQGMKWHDLDDNTQERWRELTRPYRSEFPDAWHDGRDLPDGVYVNQRDYEEHSRFIITKNRNGATPDDIVLRYQLNLQRFRGRTLKLYSTNPKFRQVVLPGF
jgi:replicative DNA helicase